jgi:hypothetical protein
MDSSQNRAFVRSRRRFRRRSERHLRLHQGIYGRPTEGGFLGFGGVRVSNAEQSLLNEVKAALQIV